MMKYDRRAVMAGGAALGAMQMVSGFDMMANISIFMLAAPSVPTVRPTALALMYARHLADTGSRRIPTEQRC